MTHIYKIVDKDTGETYVGSTSQKIHRRMKTHLQTYSRCSSRSIIEKNNYDVIIIEDCDENDRNEREQYWIDNTDCVNIKNPIFDRKAYKRKWYEEHIEEKKKYDKIRRNWKYSWGETKRDFCNLTYTDYSLFLK